MKIYQLYILFLFLCFQILLPKTNFAQVSDTIPKNKTEIEQTNYIPGSFALEEEAKLAYEKIIDDEKSLKYFFMIAFFILLVLSAIFSMYITNAFKRKTDEILAQAKINMRESELNNIKNEQLSLILNNIENAILIASPNGEISWVNEGFKSLYGFSMEELKQENRLNIIETASEKEKSYIKKCISEKENFGYTGETNDLYGSKIWFQRNLIPLLNANDEIIGIVAADNDLTLVKLAMNQINEQKKEVEHQKQNITDSINYASYIQRALLPSDNYINKLFPDNFILFRPRDIVSGDFYWVAQSKQQKILVAADCTGHGVPGAFMSVLGLSLLNEILAKAETSNTKLIAGNILDKLRAGVISALNQSGKKSITKDGMDISLCIFEPDNTMQFSGAHNSALVLRKEKNIKLPQIIRLKADRMPIGVYFKGNKEFNTETFQLQKGDTIYLHSDGFPDQFGGTKDTKFMIKKMKAILQENFEKSLLEQQEMLNTALESWMHIGQTEQIDDILVIGVKV